ncbi:unnamed protein product [Mytilus coruscus]|uniref:B box-type domain-containing protein n=1 Tax=Mytilus coruscus TaxID=42192 RepID=A0A6J8EUL5_MYTCO|nr:unnamed protein product [Mytilus coruscus]
MTIASSVQKAQLPVTCQLCDEETKINWKCLEIDFLLCDKCKSIHSKVKTQLEHYVINLKDIGQKETILKAKAELSLSMRNMRTPDIVYFAGTKLREFKKIAPKAPAALHITIDHHILVRTIEEDSEHQIEKWTMGSKVLKVFRFDNLRRNLFEMKIKLNTDSHGSIFVVDFEYDRSRGRK